MRRIQSILVAMLLFLPFTSAFGEKAKMNVTSTDGKTVTITLADQMYASSWTLRDEASPLMFYVYTGNITFDENGRPQEAEADGNLPAGTIWFEMPVSDLDRIDFTGLAGVDGITISDGIQIDLTDGVIRVSGVDSPVGMSVYSLSGVLEERRLISDDAVIDLSPLGSGVHLVSIGSSTFKVLTK